MTANLAGMASECGNISLVSARPDRDQLIASVSLHGLWSTTGAADWTALGTGAGSAPISNRGSKIVFDPDHPDTFWESGIYNGGGVFEIVPYGAAGEDAKGFDKDYEWMVPVALESARPISFGLIQNLAYPEVWRDILDKVERASEKGANAREEFFERKGMWPQGRRERGCTARTWSRGTPRRDVMNEVSNGFGAIPEGFSAASMGELEQIEGGFTPTTDFCENFYLTMKSISQGTGLPMSRLLYHPDC